MHFSTLATFSNEDIIPDNGRAFISNLWEDLQLSAYRIYHIELSHYGRRLLFLTGQYGR